MITEILNYLFENYLYLFMFFIPFIAQLGIPIGSMFFILYSASIVTGIVELNYLFFIILIAAICGDFLSYFVARKFRSTKKVNNFLKKKKVKKIHKKTNLFFDKYGNISVFITRFLITGLGPYLNYVLGLEKYDFKKFLIYVILGEILYVGELLLIGYIFRDIFEEIQSLFMDFSYLILILVILYFVVRHLFKISKR